MSRFFSPVLIAAACIVCIVTDAVAQEPSQAQRDVIRASCRSDFIANCSGVQPGGKNAFECLKRNEAKLSASCKTAVNAIVPAASVPIAPRPTSGSAESPQPPAAAAKPAPAAATLAASQKPSSEQLSAIRAACRSDFMAHCSGVQPGGPAALKCLQQNAARVSAPCQTALAAIAQAAGKGSAAGTVAAAPAAAPAVSPLGPMPTMRPREAIAILRLCSAEQQTLCRGVPVGGGRVISCLAENAVSLSPSCYAALSAAARR